MCAYADYYKNPKPKTVKAINRLSKKRQKQSRDYTVKRKIFLAMPQNRICFIAGCGKIATTIEHKKGRSGFADKHARDNNIPLLLDERFWAGCCLHHNLELERNTELSKKYQLSKLHDGEKI